MRHHRETCAEWQNRPNPLQLMIGRRLLTREQSKEQQAEAAPCSGTQLSPTAPRSEVSEERTRRDRVAKAGISPSDWGKILFVLAKRYPPYR